MVSIVLEKIYIKQLNRNMLGIYFLMKTAHLNCLY